MPVWYNGGMSLFSHYQGTGKPFPCGDGGFLEPNFHREWVFALGRNRFDMRNEQNIRTWQREWSDLSDDAKKAPAQSKQEPAHKIESFANATTT